MSHTRNEKLIAQQSIAIKDLLATILSLSHGARAPKGQNLVVNSPQSGTLTGQPNADGKKLVPTSPRLQYITTSDMGSLTSFESKIKSWIKHLNGEIYSTRVHATANISLCIRGAREVCWIRLPTNNEVLLNYQTSPYISDTQTHVSTEQRAPIQEQLRRHRYKDPISYAHLLGYLKQ
jgi:hypothetical protein